jgi:hypothetical protein
VNLLEFNLSVGVFMKLFVLIFLSLFSFSTMAERATGYDCNQGQFMAMIPGCGTLILIHPEDNWNIYAEGTINYKGNPDCSNQPRDGHTLLKLEPKKKQNAPLYAAIPNKHERIENSEYLNIKLQNSETSSLFDSVLRCRRLN